MIRILSLWFVLGVVGCSSWWGSTVPEETPWPRSESKPQRLLILNFVGFARGDHFPPLKAEGLEFSKAWLGHLPDSTSVSETVLLSGLHPKHLLTRDSKTLESFSELPPHSLLTSVPGTPEQKLWVNRPTDIPIPPKEALEKLLSFLNATPDWRLAIASFEAPSSNTNSPSPSEIFEKILVPFRENNWLAETVLLTTESGVPATPSKVAEATPQLTQLKKLPEISGIAVDHSLRIYLKKPQLASVLKIASDVRKLPQVSEVYTLREVSKRYHYIRTHRDSSISGEALEWRKARHPLLLQSLATSKAPQVVAFFTGSPTPEESQQASVLLWAPNLRTQVPALKYQLQQTSIKWVDLYPILLEIMGLPKPDQALDGSSLGISSLIY